MKKLSIIFMLFLLIVSPLVLISANASDTPTPSSVTVAGSLQSELGCSGDWDPACSATHLVFDANDNVWQNTFSVPAGSWEYKAALNDSWDENYGAGAARNGANIPLNLASPASVKFYYDHETHWITDNVNSIIATAPGSYQSELGCTGDWDPSCLRSWLQDPDGDGIYSFRTTAIPGGTYEVKVAINESWDINYGAGGVLNGPNIQFTVPSLCNETIFSYNSNTHILSVTAGDNTPPEVTCPADITVDSCASKAVNYVASASDSCGLQDFSCNPSPGSTFSVGTTTVTCTALNLVGLSASCSFNVNVNCPTSICRTAGFWGTHAGTEKARSQPISQEVITANGGSITVCGEVIDNTVGSPSSPSPVVEAMCVSVRGDQRLQLARQLTAAALNCIMSGGVGNICDTFAACDPVCLANDDQAAITGCISEIDCLNNGGKWLGDFCQMGTCAGSDVPCNDAGDCGEGIACEPLEGNCHDQQLCSETNPALCFEPPGPAGSSRACNTATSNGITIFND